MNYRRPQVRTTVDRECEPPSTANADTNNNYIINKDINNIDYININHINQFEDTDELSTYEGHSDRIDEIDRIDSQRQAYIELIRKNIEYDHVLKYPNGYDVEMYTNIFNIICDVVCVPRNFIRINNNNYPYEVVQSIFLKINSNHVEYVLQCMHNNPTKINNIKSYIMTALYNAVLTMDLYYKAEVNHDMYGY